jgi:hypothetical protein
MTGGRRRTRALLACGAVGAVLFLVALGGCEQGCDQDGPRRAATGWVGPYGRSRGPATGWTVYKRRTGVARLITQRSQVQILAPLLLADAGESLLTDS